MRRINITHLAPSTGVPSLNKDRTDKLYEQTTMGTRESLISFHERFSNALERRKAVGLPDISEDRLASRFISNLDDTRYSDFKITLANWAENNIQHLSLQPTMLQLNGEPVFHQLLPQMLLCSMQTQRKRFQKIIGLTVIARLNRLLHLLVVQ
jgi:hypothetical protein